MSGEPRGSGWIFRTLLRFAAPSLDMEERVGAAETFRTLAHEARNAGPGAYVAFLGREVRSLARTFSEERRWRRRRGRKPEPGRKLPRGTGGYLDAVRLDLKYAVRNLARSPGFVVVSVLSLSFGISVSTGVFSVVNATLFRPLPNAEAPERLVRIFTSNGSLDQGPMSYPDAMDMREAAGSLVDLAAVRTRTMVLGPSAREGRRRWGLEVSENYFQLLGIHMARGRSFLPEDIVSGGSVAVLGYHLWTDMFDSDPDILGKTVKINGHDHTIVGVAPEGMIGVGGPALVDVVTPIMEGRDERGYVSGTAVGRLKDGVAPAQVQAEMDALAAYFQEEYPGHWQSRAYGPRGIKVMTLPESLLPPGPQAVLMTAGVLLVVGLILLIACSNVANLLLTRALKRREEVAIRSSVGASGRRILAQLLTENLLLFVLAGGVSLLFMEWFSRMVAAGTSLIPGIQANITIDGRVLLFVAALVVTIGLAFGLAPALQASRPNLVAALKGREPPPRFRLFGIRNLLVGAQVGGSLVLVLVTLLLVQSLSHAGTMDLGFDDTGVAVLEVNMEHRDLDEAQGRTFQTDLLARARTLPGVSEAALAAGIPLRGTSSYLGNIQVEGYEPSAGEWMGVLMNVVSPGYLGLMDIQILRGRDLSPDDREGTEPVALVSQAFVDRYWPGEAGLGKSVRSSPGVVYRVVGVVENIPWRMPGEDPEPLLWLSFAQTYSPRMVLHVRTQGDPGALLQPLRALLADVDPDMPVMGLDRLETLTANATQVHRLLSRTLGAAGGFTLLLAMLGIYGIVAFSVSQRTREVGLRVALGAEPGQVVAMVLREGMTLAAIGLAPGLLLSVIIAHLMRAALMGLRPLDPVAFGGGVGLLLLSVVAATWLPAWRAARCDPMRALREE